MSSIRVNEKVLLVDDEPRVLAGYLRHLSANFNVDTAPDGPSALAMLDGDEPYAVVVSDLRMPGMDGIELLGRLREASPDTVRIMLTGFADVNNAIAAVNQGKIFRFLTKPCDSQTLIEALVEGVKHYRLVTAERQLLEQTLNGSIKVFLDLLTMIKPEAFGRSSRIASWAGKLASFMKVEDAWEVNVAASLSQIGLITLPDNIIHKVNTGRALSTAQAAAYAKHPALTAELVAKIPRLEKAAQIIAYQEKHYDGSGVPDDDIKGGAIPLGARILKLAIDFDALLTSGRNKGEAYRELKGRLGFYDPDVYNALGELLGAEKKYALEELEVYQLKPHMLLAQDVMSLEPRRLLLAKGQELSEQVIEFLRKYRHTVGVEQPIKVITPLWLK